jgi:hypothetical protein
MAKKAREDAFCMVIPQYKPEGIAQRSMCKTHANTASLDDFHSIFRSLRLLD